MHDFRGRHMALHAQAAYWFAWRRLEFDVLVGAAGASSAVAGCMRFERKETRGSQVEKI